MIKVKALVNITLGSKEFRAGVSYEIAETVLQLEKKAMKWNAYLSKVFEEIKTKAKVKAKAPLADEIKTATKEVGIDVETKPGVTKNK